MQNDKVLLQLEIALRVCEVHHQPGNATSIDKADIMAANMLPTFVHITRIVTTVWGTIYTPLMGTNVCI